MKFKYQAALLTTALALGSCASDAMFDDGTGSGATGSVTKPGVEVSNVENVINDSGRASYDITPFILDFYRVGETEPFMSSAYGDLKATVDLPAGDYTISVRSHEVQKAEFDKPYFTGSSDQFTIESEKITTVNLIKCVFSSIKVSVVFGSKLREVMGDNIEVTVVANDAGKLTWTPNETRAGYFEAVEGSSTMAVTFKGTVDGYAEEITQTFADIAKGQHRIITFETGGSLPTPDEPTGTLNIGGLQIDFDYTDESLDGSVNPGNEDVINDGEEEPGKLPDIIDEDPEDPEDPTTDPEDPTDPTEDSINFEGGNIENGQAYGTSVFNESYPASIVLNAPKGFKDVVVTIDSPDGGLDAATLEGVGLAGTFSLVNSTEFFEKLGGLGFPTGDNVSGHTSIDVDITGFMGLLNALGETTNIFTMKVTDLEDGTGTLTFTLLGNK